MIRLLPDAPDRAVVPQAIFWRPLRYFTPFVREGEDDLDCFMAASFVVGDKTRFDLRYYPGHPEGTVTLYLPEEVEDEHDISASIGLVVQEMVIPRHAVAWRRGMPFEYGVLSRHEADRLRPPEARILALKIAAQCEDHHASSWYIKSKVPEYIQLTQRKRVHAHVSHPPSSVAVWELIMDHAISSYLPTLGPLPPPYQRHAIGTHDGLTVTPLGMGYLGRMGFFPLEGDPKPPGAGLVTGKRPMVRKHGHGEGKRPAAVEPLVDLHFPVRSSGDGSENG